MKSIEREREITLLWSRVFAIHKIYKGHSSAEQWEGMSYRDIFSRIVETIFAVNMLDCSSVLRNPYQARHYFIFPCDKCPFGLEPLRLGAFRQSNTSILVS